MRTIYKIEMKKPTKTFRKKLKHDEAVQVINNCEQNIYAHIEFLKYNILPFLNVVVESESKNERVVRILEPDKNLKEIVKIIALQELTIENAKKYIKKEVKTLFSYYLPYTEPDKEYENFLNKIFIKNRLSYAPIEFY